MININKIYCGDCLEVMKDIDDGCIDMILCDLPYECTKNSWDVIIPFDLLWNQYNRIIKKNGAIVLTASQPFTSMLIMSNLKAYKYNWTWNKVNKFSGHLNCKKQPMRIVEDICVFYYNQPTYNPQMVKGEPYVAVSRGKKTSSYGKQIDNVKTVNEGLYYPKNLISIKGDERGGIGRLHPTQKPVKLFEYLVQTYSNQNDLILDNCAGICTTAVACENLQRQWICIEKEQKYCDIGLNRINNTIFSI